MAIEGVEAEQLAHRYLAIYAEQCCPCRHAVETVKRLRARYRLGILSNVDDGLLAWTRRHLAAFFETVVTAQQVGSYKPASAHFTTARNLIGGKGWLHAAQSYYHDVAPCRALGIPVAWINRKGETAADGGSPEHEFRTLGALADWLAPSVM